MGMASRCQFPSRSCAVTAHPPDDPPGTESALHAASCRFATGGLPEGNDSQCRCFLAGLRTLLCVASRATLPPMRILLCTADGGGNVPALASIVGELVRRGHTVRVLAGPYFPGAPRSESLEASFSAAGCEVVNREAEAWLEGAGPMPDILAIPDHLQMLRSMAIWMPMSVPWAVETAREIESFRPAVV